MPRQAALGEETGLTSEARPFFVGPAGLSELGRRAQKAWSITDISGPEPSSRETDVAFLNPQGWGCNSYHVVTMGSWHTSLSDSRFLCILKLET